MARTEARRLESIVGGAGLGWLGQTHSALLVGVQALSGGFRTLHCLSVVTESWIQTSGSQTPSKSLSRTQNSYPLKNPKVSQIEHTPANGKGVERQKIIKGVGESSGVQLDAFQNLKICHNAFFDSIIIFGRTYAKGKRPCLKIQRCLFLYIMKSLKHHKKPRTGNQLRKLCYMEMMY